MACSAKVVVGNLFDAADVDVDRDDDVDKDDGDDDKDLQRRDPHRCPPLPHFRRWMTFVPGEWIE